MTCIKDFTCYCSLEEGVRSLWKKNAELNLEIPVTEDEETNLFDVDGTLYGKRGQYVYLQDVGEVSSISLNNTKIATQQYRLWTISCDKDKRDEISNRAHKELVCCPNLMTEEGNICKIDVGRPTKSYDAENCLFLAASNMTVTYSLRRQCCGD